MPKKTAKNAPHTRQDSEDQFDRLADEMIARAEAIKCPIEDFVAGLRAMADRLHERANIG